MSVGLNMYPPFCGSYPKYTASCRQGQEESAPEVLHGQPKGLWHCPAEPRDCISSAPCQRRREGCSLHLSRLYSSCSRSWEAGPQLRVGTGGTCLRWCGRNGNPSAAPCAPGPGTRAGLRVRRAEGRGVYLEQVGEEDGQADLQHQHRHDSWHEGGDGSLEHPNRPCASSRAGGTTQTGDRNGLKRPKDVSGLGAWGWVAAGSEQLGGSSALHSSAVTGRGAQGCRVCSVVWCRGRIAASHGEHMLKQYHPSILHPSVYSEALTRSFPAFLPPDF